MNTHWDDSDFEFVAKRLRDIQAENKEASPKPRPDLPAPDGSGYETYFEWWRHQFFSNEGGAP